MEKFRHTPAGFWEPSIRQTGRQQQLFMEVGFALLVCRLFCLLVWVYPCNGAAKLAAVLFCFYFDLGRVDFQNMGNEMQTCGNIPDGLLSELDWLKIMRPERKMLHLFVLRYIWRYVSRRNVVVSSIMWTLFEKKGDQVQEYIEVIFIRQKQVESIPSCLVKVV